MHIVTCDADRAFTLLRRISQQSNRKLAEVAAALVQTRGRGLEDELTALAE